MKPEQKFIWRREFEFNSVANRLEAAMIRRQTGKFARKE